jgi:hypothetical protein
MAIAGCGGDDGSSSGTTPLPAPTPPPPPPIVVTPPPASTPTAFEMRAKEVTDAWAIKKPENKPQRIVYHAIAQYAAGKTDEANANIEKVLATDLSSSTQGEIEAFVGQPLAYAIMRYGDQMGAERKDRAIAKIKSFNPLEGASENHKLLYRSMGLVIAATSPDTPWVSATNQDVLTKCKQYLLNEANVAFKNGLWEFDSSNYIQFHINSWILVHDFSPDPEMRAIAKNITRSYICRHCP